jgi:hypothetical protein
MELESSSNHLPHLHNGSHLPTIAGQVVRGTEPHIAKGECFNGFISQVPFSVSPFREKINGFVEQVNHIATSNLKTIQLVPMLPQIIKVRLKELQQSDPMSTGVRLDDVRGKPKF